MSKPKRSKANARKNKGGRPRKQGPRHPAGKIVQPTASEKKDNAVAVAQKARQRLHGLSKADAALPEAGDVLGRLYLTQEISRTQFEAGQEYARIVADYDKALLAPRQRSASNFDGPAGYDDSDGKDASYQAWVKRAKQRYDEARSAVLLCGEPLAHAVLRGVIDGYEMPNHVGELRIALNALSRVVHRREQGGL